MSSLQGVQESTRRQLSPRQAATVQLLTDAAAEELRSAGFDALTVRNVAKAAGVAPATAYTYFTSREHLVAEVFWRRLVALPPQELPDDVGRVERVTVAVRDFAMLVAGEPELSSACTVAMLSNDPDVKALRDRIGMEQHRRLLDSLRGPAGDTIDPVVLSTLNFAVAGALLQAGMGHMDYDDLPGQLARVVELVVR